MQVCLLWEITVVSIPWWTVWGLRATQGHGECRACGHNIQRPRNLCWHLLVKDRGGKNCNRSIIHLSHSDELKNTYFKATKTDNISNICNLIFFLYFFFLKKNQTGIYHYDFYLFLLHKNHIPTFCKINWNDQI